MKKFAFLLALIAVLAMSAAAFAALGDNDVATLQKSGTACAVGKISGTDPQDGSPKVDGDYTANVYYYGTISAAAKADVYVWLSTGNRTSTSKFYATTKDKPADGDPSGTASGGWIPHFKLADLETTTPVAYTFGKANDDSTPTDWASNVAKAKLTLTPTEVKIAPLGTVTVKAGDTKDLDIDIALTDADLTPTFDAAFTVGAVSPTEGAPTVIANAKTGVRIDAASAKAGTYTVKISAGDSNSLMIAEAGGASDIFVANFPRDAFEVGTLTINVVDYYTADPSSATWDGGTAGVKFTVDMPHSDFNAIGLKRPDDEDVRELGKVYYTVTPTADGIEIELKPEWLSTLTVSGDYVYSVGDKKGRDALFTLTVTGQGGTVPLNGAKPSFESGEEPKGVEFGIIQSIMTKDDIVSLDERIGEFLDENGMISQDKAASLIGVDEDALTVLPTVETKLSGGKTIAAITFGVTGSELVSEEARGIRWYDAIIHKMYVGSTGPASVTLAPARTWGAIANGTFMILNESDELLAEDHLVERKGATQYKLVVYVEDNGAYDLDNRTELHVVDPVAIQKSSGGSSSSGSGACSTGFGLVAVTGLAVLALHRRSK